MKVLSYFIKFTLFIFQILCIYVPLYKTQSSQASSQEENIIISYRSLNMIKAQTSSELIKIVKGWNLDFDTGFQINESATGILVNSTIKINNIRIKEVALKTNFTNSLNASLWESSALLVQTKDNFLSIQLTFDFAYWFGGYTNGNGTMYISTDSFQFIKSYISTPTYNNISITSSTRMVLNSHNISVDKNDDLKALIAKGLNNNVNTEIKRRLVRSMNSEIQKYYYNGITIHSFKIETTFPNKIMTFRTSDRNIKVKNLLNGAVYYIRNADFNTTRFKNIANENKFKLIHQEKPSFPNKLLRLKYLEFNNISNDKKEDDIWDNFNESEGNFQIFMHKGVLKNVANFITSDNQFSFNNVTNQNLPKNLINLNLNIENLGKALIGLYRTRPMDEPLSVDITINSVTLDSVDSQNVIGRFTLHSIINSDSTKEELLNVISEFNFGLRLVLGSDFNLNFAVDIDTLNIKSIYCSNYILVDSTRLANLLTDSLKMAITNMKYRLFKDTLSLSQLFSKIYAIRNIQDKGFLFIGDF